MTPLKSSILEQIETIRHGFGTQDEPTPLIHSDQKIWENRPIWKQVHGTDTARVENQRQNCGDVDALWTQQIQIPIAVVTADCVPLLFAHRSGRAVAAVHAGWRGTLTRIAEKLWKQLHQAGENPQEWIAAIGPCIGSCCYEVSEEIIDRFKTEFPQVPPKIWNPRDRILDLGSLHRETLREMGLGTIDWVQACTRCSPSPRFFSYRRGDRDSRQYSSIVRIA